MKPILLLTSVLLLHFALAPARGQFGPGGGGGGGMFGAQLSGPMSKLFGDNTAFSATMVAEMQDPADKTQWVTMPAHLAFQDAMSRLDMDLSQVKSSRMRPEMAAQLKMLGMAEMSLISRPDRKLTYLVYPGLKSFAKNPIAEADAATPDKKFKIDTTELGKETVDGHPCVKNRVVVMDEAGKAHESIVWNATDLKKFPIKIEQDEHGQKMKISFKDVKFDKPEAALFEPPKEFTSYANIQSLMQAAMMKSLGGGGVPPKQP